MNEFEQKTRGVDPKEALRAIEALALSYPGGPDEHADPGNTCPEDAGAHVTGLILREARAAIGNTSVTAPAQPGEDMTTGGEA